jgi:hypothetical protein
MDEQTKKTLHDGGMHVLHGLEDAVDVVGHGVAGAVKGVADGVESASAATQTRDADSK